MTRDEARRTRSTTVINHGDSKEIVVAGSGGKAAKRSSGLCHEELGEEDECVGEDLTQEEQAEMAKYSDEVSPIRAE